VLARIIRARADAAIAVTDAISGSVRVRRGHATIDAVRSLGGWIEETAEERARVMGSIADALAGSRRPASTREGGPEAPIEERATVRRSETDEAFIVSIDMPGATSDSVLTEMDDRTLFVTSTRPAEGDRRAVRYRAEVAVPARADPTSVVAELKEGVLRVEIMKSEQARRHRVPLRSTPGGRSTSTPTTT
jgi:HSP20 family molecular chaperone IbpA